jgi:hypothetical protein
MLQRFHRPACRNWCPSTTLRAAANSSANAKSAVVSVSTSGVLVTRMPRAVAAGTSMLSKPTATLAITRTPSSRAIAPPSKRSVNWLTRACLPTARRASSSAVNPSSESA